MITPRFSLTQDDTFLIINIRAPYCSLKELEVSIDGQDFRFICSPFYLRLNLPGRVLDNDAATGEFLSDKGEFLFKYAKETKGEYFEGLQLITSLLAPSRKNLQVPQIEVLPDASDVYSTADDSEWYINQEVPAESDMSMDDIYKYGFANQKYDVLRNTEDEYYSVFEIRNVEKMSTTDRKHLRHDTEAMKFSYEHYLADYFDDEIVKTKTDQPNPWSQLDKVTVSFTGNERDILKDLPNKEYLLNTDELNKVLYSLVDILFAYCYDKRSTNFESNCESGWTITRLSATLSWFDHFDNEKDALVSGYRRSLVYPLYRSFDLCTEVLKDLRLCLNLGTVFIVKCLLDIYDIFNTSSDPMYILNELYIKDYIVFMQKCPKAELENMILHVADASVTGDEVNLNLSEIVQDAIRNCLSGETILDKMSKLNISASNSDSETDSESDSSDDSSTDSDDSSSS